MYTWCFWQILAKNWQFLLFAVIIRKYLIFVMLTTFRCYTPQTPDFRRCYDHKNLSAKHHYFLLLYSANTRFSSMLWSQKFGLL
jgi:hypothetical protein